MKHEILNEIINSDFSDIIFQPTKNIFSPTNMYVINFVKGKKTYSLHIFCFLRIVLNDQILLTSTDECFDKDHKPVTEYNKDNSLVNYNISNVKKIALDSTVIDVQFLNCGDLIITLSDNTTIEVRPDCLMNSFEYYRIFEYENQNNQLIISCEINNDKLR